MTNINNSIVSPRRLALGGTCLSEILAGQPKLPTGRWTLSISSTKYRAMGARFGAVEIDPAMHAALVTGAPTDVPTTGVPPSVVKRRT